MGDFSQYDGMCDPERVPLAVIRSRYPDDLPPVSSAMSLARAIHFQVEALCDTIEGLRRALNNTAGLLHHCEPYAPNPHVLQLIRLQCRDAYELLKLPHASQDSGPNQRTGSPETSGEDSGRAPTAKPVSVSTQGGPAGAGTGLIRFLEWCRGVVERAGENG